MAAPTTTPSTNSKLMRLLRRSISMMKHSPSRPTSRTSRLRDRARAVASSSDNPTKSGAQPSSAGETQTGSGRASPAASDPEVPSGSAGMEVEASGSRMGSEAEEGSRSETKLAERCPSTRSTLADGPSR